MNTPIFKRKAYEKLLEWKRNSGGKTALLIEGARRVGKSTLVEQFAKNEYARHIIIDFSRASRSVTELFEDMENLDVFFLLLQTHYGVTLIERQSVIVFDEVQLCPPARQAIKHLVADGRYDYIETGSLISIRRNTKDIVIPSEERRIEMLPLDFEEFCWAIGDTATVPLLSTFLTQHLPLKQAHRAILRKLRLYMLIGGMPQAICAYLDANNIEAVDRVKRDILLLYMEDFLKIDNLGRLSKLFMAIPAQLNRNVSRYYPTGVVGNVETEKLSELLFELENSKAINVAYHANDPNVGMALNADYDRYKLFLSDTGLFVTLAFWDKDYTENVIYNKLLSDKLSSNLGYIYENLVAQMLRASGNRLFYYTFPKDAKHNYEIDFLLSRGNKVCPIEVKSSGYNTHTSLDAFCVKYSSRVGQSYLLHTKDSYRDGSTLCLPIYMTGLL